MERKKNIQTVQAIVGSSTVALTVTIILIIGKRGCEEWRV